MKYLFLLTSSLAIATPALAQSADEVVVADRVRDDLITVVATGSATRLDMVGQPVSVIGTDEIAAAQGPDLTRVLERLPGVTLARNGGLGSNTSLFVRGANSQQLLVLVDGLRVAEVAAPGGGYDFGNQTTGGVGRIELLRGSNSVVWGSEAIGGVLALTSRDLDGAEASLEYGARDSLDGQVTAGLAGETYGVTLNGGYTSTDGVSQADGGSEQDGFRQWRAGGRAHLELTPGLTASLVGRYTHGKLDIDGYPAPLYTFADTPEYQKTREIGGRAGLTWTSAPLDLDAGYQISDTRRRFYDPTYSSEPNYGTQGQSRRAEFKGAWRATEALRLDFGADHEWSSINVGGSAKRKANLSSGHALLGWYSDAFTLAGGVRYDDHSRFGDAWTFGANGSVAVTGLWRVRASYGEGFKVPTLYQLFSEYGNTALRPEKSRSYDAGIEYGDRNGVLHFALTGFRRDSRDLIDYVTCFSVPGSPLCEPTGGAPRYGYYDNVGRARATGIEVELGARASENLRAQAVYTYVKAVNRTRGDLNQGNDLARRPRHALTVSADWTTPLAGLVLGGDVRLVGDSYDDAGNFTRLDSYALGTVRASLPIGERLEVFGRVENVTDEDYAVAGGYATAGRSAFIGARARM